MEIKECNVECNDIKADAISSEEKDEKFYECLTAPATTSEAESIKSGRLLKLSYGLCLAVVYSQLTMLLYMVGFCAFKLGFLFLLACVATIAYFVLKVSENEELCQDCPQKTATKIDQMADNVNDYPKCINFCQNKRKLE